MKCKEFYNSIRKRQNKIHKRYGGHSPKENINDSYTNLKMLTQPYNKRNENENDKLLFCTYQNDKDQIKGFVEGKMPPL